MLKKIFLRAGFGFILGVAVCSIITAITSDGTQVAPAFANAVGSAKWAVLLQLLLAGLCGAISMGGTVLYDVDRLPLSLGTLFHCLLCVIPFVSLALLLHWVEGTVGALVFAFAQIAAFFVIWLILFLLYRKQIRELNAIQNKNLSKTEEKGS